MIPENENAMMNSGNISDGIVLGLLGVLGVPGGMQV